MPYPRLGHHLPDVVDTGPRDQQGHVRLESPIAETWSTERGGSTCADMCASRVRGEV